MHRAKVVLLHPDLHYKAKKKMNILLNQSIKQDTSGLVNDSYIKDIVDDYESKQSKWEYVGPPSKPIFDPNVLKIVSRVDTSPP